MSVAFEESVGQRVVVDLTIPCPAGEPVGETLEGSGCLCRLTASVIASATDPRSLGKFCTDADGHKLCPVWQTEKKRIEEHARELAEVM